MPRYLTPSKLALLVLIRVYVDGHLAATATVPVLAFLMGCILPPKHDRPATSKIPIQIDDFQEALSKLQSDSPGRTVWDLFLKKLWEFDSLDSLSVFFEDLHLLLTKTREEFIKDRDAGFIQDRNEVRLARNSPLGVSVRRAQVEFMRMQMEDTVILWKSLLEFREPSRAYVRRRNSSLSKISFDSNVPMDGEVHDVLYGDIDSGQFHAADTSGHDVELLLEFQLSKVQKGGERVPLEVKQQLSEMATSAIDMPVRISYIDFLDAWRGGDYPSAHDHLHRYFDYTMQSRDRSFYQYALLNLAILHADFGSWTEAISAITETISTAREHKDLPCLNYALSWLFHFGKANPNEIDEYRKAGVLGTDKEGLSFLKAKAKESSMWGLLATCYLTEARQAQINGESLALAFEGIAKASHLNLTKDVQSNIGSELNLQSAIFSRLGQKHLACTSNEVFLTCYTGSAQSEDLLHFTCKSALLKAASGHYTEAYTILESIVPSITRIIKHQQFWTACNLLIQLRQAINKTDYIAAEHFLAQLQANMPTNHDISFAVTSQAIDLEIRRGQLDIAMDLVETQLSTNKSSERDLWQHIKYMVIKAQILAKAGLPQKGFSLSLRACSLAQKAGCLVVLWEAIGALSAVFCSMKGFAEAVSILKPIMPQLLETDDVELIARSYSYLADAYSGQAGEEQTGSAKQKEYLTKVLECLESAFDYYSKQDHVLGQCEMLAKKAVVLRRNGDDVLANDAATKYLGIREAATMGLS